MSAVAGQDLRTFLAQVLVSVVISTVAAVIMDTVVQRTTFKTSRSTVVQAANLASVAVSPTLQSHQTQLELQVLLRWVKLVARLSTRSALLVFAAVVPTTAVPVMTSVVLPTGARQAGVNVLRRTMIQMTTMATQNV